jgi:hypothetical protein
MGFSRYHEIDTDNPAFLEIWPQLVQDAARIVAAAGDEGVVLRGSWGRGRPIVTDAAVDDEDSATHHERGAISFNGAADRGEDCEGFLVSPDMNEPRRSWFTKTERQPYDVVISAVLLRAKALAPAATRIGADHWGEPGDAWTDGRAMLNHLGLTAGDPDDGP